MCNVLSIKIILKKSRSSQISLFTKCFFNQQVLIVDALILASAALLQLRSQYYKKIQILYVRVVQVWNVIS